MERLVEFKVAYGQALEEVRLCLMHFFPDMTEGDIHDFIYSFFPFMFGIYPYTSVTDKQREDNTYLDCIDKQAIKRQVLQETREKTD